MNFSFDPELRQCPFCGSIPRIAKDMDEDLWSHNIVEWQQVKCTECECEGIRTCEGFDIDAVTMWNTRAIDKRRVYKSQVVPDSEWKMYVWVVYNKEGGPFAFCTNEPEASIFKDGEVAIRYLIDEMVPEPKI